MNTPKSPTPYDLERIKTYKIDIETGRVYSQEGYELGALHQHGYIYIHAGARPYKRSNIVWWFATGSWPKLLLDHINRSKSDDRLVNLREATDRENRLNRERRSSLPTGVTLIPGCVSRPYKAQARVNGKYVYLGVHATPEEAHQAYKKAVNDLKSDG